MSLKKFIEQLDDLAQLARQSFQDAGNAEQLELARVEFLGAKKGRFKAVQKELGTIDRADKPVAGKKLNEVKNIGIALNDLEPEDLLNYGLIPEFVGRLPIVTTLEDLDEESLIKILQEPKNALVKQYQTLFNMEDVKLILSKDALKVIAKKAIERKTGARGLRSILENILLDTMFELPSLEGVEEVVINAEVAEGRARPLYIYADNKKTSETSA